MSDETSNRSEELDTDAGSAKTIVEALLFAADEPLSARRLASIADVTPATIDDLVRELNADYLQGGRAFRIERIAEGYRMLTRPELALWVRMLHRSPGRPRLSQAALETLSIVAYRQPVARTELEAIRGVNVDGVLKTLLERDLIRIAGRSEGLGRPLLYATTDRFLEYFGLPDLGALPRPEEVQISAVEPETQAELFEERPASGNGG